MNLNWFDKTSAKEDMKELKKKVQKGLEEGGKKLGWERSIKDRMDRLNEAYKGKVWDDLYYEADKLKKDLMKEPDGGGE